VDDTYSGPFALRLVHILGMHGSCMSSFCSSHVASTGRPLTLIDVMHDGFRPLLHGRRPRCIVVRPRLKHKCQVILSAGRGVKYQSPACIKPSLIIRILDDHQSVRLLPAHSLLALAVMLDDVIQLCPLVDSQVDEDAASARVCPVTRWQEVVATLQLELCSGYPTLTASAVDGRTAQG
jgi:hypothetical protein